MFEQFIGTKPVEDRHRIDVACLEEYLKLRVRGLEQFKGGQSNPTYRITAADGRRFVLRFEPGLRSWELAAVFAPKIKKPAAKPVASSTPRRFFLGFRKQTVTPKAN